MRWMWIAPLEVLNQRISDADLDEVSDLLTKDTMRARRCQNESAAGTDCEDGCKCVGEVCGNLDTLGTECEYGCICRYNRGRNHVDQEIVRPVTTQSCRDVLAGVAWRQSQQWQRGNKMRREVAKGIVAKAVSTLDYNLIPDGGLGREPSKEEKGWAQWVLNRVESKFESMKWKGTSSLDEDMSYAAYVHNEEAKTMRDCDV